MAQRTITTLVDDLDGTDLGQGSGETIRFGVDGRAYEIDLSDDNAGALRDVLRPYTEAGRRVVPLSTRRRRQ
ncbi:histone-like nucleoid-structuring protein Lsr2 [Plantibacter sp. CFBP 13570]|uniref:histone-like nucleoid-structuring protein Lsr2 n=1 Tax=Plantibacter sp. CFBP 13570 TaxID=2775272 RepID=UPI001930AB5E|nr:Lsr2 family protein [Plantibacter sp. CFBP 13570]MBD8535673.1 Lsr2 family protein [Plantibacter sp. CFBP 13570]